MTSTCKGCGRKIVYAIDENGTRQCLDAVSPVYQLVDDDLGTETRCRRSTTAHVSHFVTCPQRDLFRKAKPANQSPGSGP